MSFTGSLQAGFRLLRLASLRAAGMPLALAANLLLGRLLGPSGFGVYSCYLSVGLVASSFVVLGADKVITRELARRDRAERGAALWWLLAWVWRSHAPLLLAAILGFAAWFAVSLAWSGHPAFVASAFLIVPFYAGTILVAGILIGFGEVGAAQSLDNIVKNLVLLGGVALAWLLHQSGSAWCLLLQAAAFAAAVAVGLTYLGAIVKPDWRHGAGPGLSPAQGRGFKSSSLAFFIGGSAVALIGRFDVILVSLFCNAEQTGLFGAANRFAQLGSVIPLVVMYKLQPVFSRAHLMRPGAVRRKLLKGRLASFALSALFLGAASVWAGALLGLMGPGFAAAVPAFRVLMIGCIVNAAVTADIAYLAMTGWEGKLARISWMQLGLIVLLAYGLVPLWGALGGAIAYLGASLAASAGIHVLSRHALTKAEQGGLARTDASLTVGEVS